MPAHVLAFGSLVEDFIGDLCATCSKAKHHRNARMIAENLGLDLIIEEHLCAPIANLISIDTADEVLPDPTDRRVDVYRHIEAGENDRAWITAPPYQRASLDAGSPSFVAFDGLLPAAL